MAQSRIVNHRDSHKQSIRAIGVGVILLAALLAAYFNTFHASWHYDDFSNIVENPKVHVTQLSWPALRTALSAGLHHQLIGRPLAYLSFAINYRFSGLHVFGYHVVNFAIHWLAAVFLFLFIRNVFKLPLLKHYEKHADSIALIAALLWAAHPIQVTAVTYVVQRMASMAGLFYIAAMYFYLKGRLAGQSSRQYLFFGLFVFSSACALLTKENAVLIIFALWLLDLTLIQGLNRVSVRKNLILLLAGTIVIVLLGFLYTNPGKLFEPFIHRPFTQVERLLTEPRVLFFYLFLIIVPMASSMGIIHDIEISRSLTVPWTTALSIFGLLAILIGLILLARRHPLLSFCGLFFLLNHLVEGSFLNLELIYEHRNYIPSMMLFVPVGMAVANSREFFYYRRPLLYMINVSLMVLIISQIHTTFRYNKIFYSELDTWSHVVTNYPGLGLGHLNLGKVYWDAGLFDKAEAKFRTALDVNRFNNLYQKGMVYFNLGMYEALKKHNYAGALELFEKAKAIYPDAMILREIGLNHLMLEEYAAAIASADTVLKSHPDDAKAMMIKAQGLRGLGDRESAAEILERLLRRYEKKSIVLLALIEMYSEMNQGETVDRLIGEFLESNKGQGIKAGSISIEQPELPSFRPDVHLLERLFNAYIERLEKQG